LQIAAWIDLKRIETLNVTGARASRDPEIYRKFLKEVVSGKKETGVAS
jgi:hypothetical protein